MKDMSYKGRTNRGVCMCVFVCGRGKGGKKVVTNEAIEKTFSQYFQTYRDRVLIVAPTARTLQKVVGEE